MGESVRVQAIKKVNTKKQIIYGEVYAPNELDSQGEFMSAETIEEMAYKYMTLSLGKTIDIQHNEVPTSAYPVESFIARKGDPDYTEGAWVLGVHVPDVAIWSAIERGEINGFSFQALTTKTAVVVDVSYDPESIGVTEPSDDGHTHLFYVRVGDDGKVLWGNTTEDAGHSHEIKRASATEKTLGHSHRFFM